MDWAPFVLPLILIAGWILKQLANNQGEQARREELPRPRPPQAFEKPPERSMAGANRPPEEIRKFLEELRR